MNTLPETTEYIGTTFVNPDGSFSSTHGNGNIFIVGEYWVTDHPALAGQQVDANAQGALGALLLMLDTVDIPL